MSASHVLRIQLLYSANVVSSDQRHFFFIHRMQYRQFYPTNAQSKRYENTEKEKAGSFYSLRIGLLLPSPAKPTTYSSRP